MALTKDEAVCIRQWDWSETSQTLSLFSRGHGVLRCVAKGSKRADARFSGGVEVLARGEVLVSLKAGDQMSILAGWDLVEVFPAVRRGLEAFHAGLTMADVVHHTVLPLDPHPALYDALVDGLRRLAADPRGALLGVVWAALTESGHRPELFRDAATGAALGEGATYTFSARAGGLVGGPVEGPVWKARAATVELLRTMSRAGASTTADATVVDGATRLLAHYFREVFGVEPPTFGRLLAERGPRAGA